MSKAPDLALVEALIAVAERSGLSELEVSAGETRIRIVRSGSGPMPPGAMPARSASAAAAGAEPRHEVRSGMSAVFYRAPSPGAPPFVEVGDAVSEGQVLALFEVMKMLTPLEADAAGEIASIDVEDGDAVEPGTLLMTMRVRPPAAAAA